MKPYEWMVEYTPQTEWIDRKGILVWLAEVFGGLGSGLYLVSSYFDCLWGMLISWLIIVGLKGGFHFAYLGKPFRFWRIALNPGTSWLARGFIFVALFIGFGALQLYFSYWLPGTLWEVVFRGLSGIMAFLIALNTGFVLNYSTGIPFWNSALLPVLFILCGVLDGLALMMTIDLFAGGVDLSAAEAGSRLLLMINAFLIATYLWSGSYTGPTGKQSVKRLLNGPIAPIFWAGVILCGILLPIGISTSSYFIGGLSVLLLIMATVFEMIGAFSLKYAILKGGLYSPLVPGSTHT